MKQELHEEETTEAGASAERGKDDIDDGNNDWANDPDGGFMVWYDVYHKPCNTYLGRIDASTAGTITFFCPVCKVDVYVAY